MSAIVSAPPVKHFINSIGITPSIYSPLDTRPVVKYKFAPGEVLVVPPMPNRPRDFSKAQLGNTNGFQFKLPDSMNVALANKYNLFDEKQRIAANTEVKLLNELAEKANKFKASQRALNVYNSIRKDNEQKVMEKARLINNWEIRTFKKYDPANPPSQKELADAELQTNYEAQLKKEENINSAQVAKVARIIESAPAVLPSGRVPSSAVAPSAGLSSQSKAKFKLMSGLPDESGAMLMIRSPAQLRAYIENLPPIEKGIYLNRGDVKAVLPLIYPNP